MGKFKVSTKPVAAPAPASAAEFVAGAALVQSQGKERPAKPVRVNFDLTPEEHLALKNHATQQGRTIAQVLRRLIATELSR